MCIDSRNISPGKLFVAIKGDVHDGHGFADDVIRKGAGGLVIRKDKKDELPYQTWSEKGIVCLAVDDTTRALGDLAAFHRKRTNVSVVAITGSNGKTTTREMTAAVLSRRFNTLSSSKNFNNDIGVPLTLFMLNSDHQWAVVELGMNAPGEIDRLAEICRPDIGVITNIGPVHLEGVGSLDGVMRAKGELLPRINPDGTAVLNADDHRVVSLAEKTRTAVLFFGTSGRAQIRALDLKGRGRGTTFTLVLLDEQISIDLKIPGAFMVSNALAAAAVGYQLGIPAAEIKAGLESFQPVQGRMNILETRKGIHIIDDTYNANPRSMEAALTTFKELKGDNRGVFVAGDMLELGAHAESSHYRIGALAVRSGILRLYVTGAFAEKVTAGAHSENMELQNIFRGNKKEILEDLARWLQPGDWILIKGSRGMRMEEIVEGLMNED
ncbi:MAG: UDP-N-acetylmuramoyl-tripeptide--D-alanyl-D-alanine ligase [Deltaproteobacteria bacterium]|nr:MAG: UDP-N-acetylmuramoyl-tripeptide--D-alanyl-D-alanine ligase [Deltaproteobacteria bacterium]